ncbi:MAG: inositol monophosphatase family protein [Rikenellaceae bacterium]
MDYSEICAAVKTVAKSAGDFIAEQRESFTFDKVEFKGKHNLVSYVDKGAEEIIVKALSEILPEAGFLTEEGTVESSDKPLRWVVDPLDGTTNFVHSLAPYCVSIALMDGAEVVVGVVYEITSCEMFYAWKGSDAYLNGKKIRCSSVDKLDNALVTTGFAYKIDDAMASFLKQIEYYQTYTDGIRRIGSAAAVMVYVACGRIDAFTQLNLCAWDVAAGALIAERAGAVVSDCKGGDDYIFGGQMVATNDKIYKEFLETL